MTETMAEEMVSEAPVGDHGPDNGIPAQGVPARGKWAHKMEFIFSMAGRMSSVSNVWYFPFMCLNHGGVAFLFPYILLFIVCGMPVMVLETAVGQYTSEGGLTAWKKICPMFQGVGVASHVILTYSNIFFIVVLAWTLFYMWGSFQSPLPWSTCDNMWNTNRCIPGNQATYQPDSNWSFLHNYTVPTGEYLDDFHDFTRSPAEEYWNYRVLRTNNEEGISVNTLHWDLVLCLLLAWIVCYFCVWKGYKSTGKAAYFTVTAPYLLLFMLFIRGVTLPGAGEGLRYFLMPDFSRLADERVWFGALNAVFITCGLCFGVPTALGSYNKYNNNFYRDCLALCCVNAATGIFAGAAVFSVLGFLAAQLNVDLNEVNYGGPGLAFISFPEALSLLPGSNFWHVVFFLMIFLLALGSQFVCVESLATAISDLFPRHLRKSGARELLVLAIAVICFLLGLIYVTNEGENFFHMMDIFGANEIIIYTIVFFQTVAIAWIYGADRFLDNIEDMIGYRPFSLLKYSWLIITPLLSVLAILYSTVGQRFHTHGSRTIWMFVLRMVVMTIPLMCIPVYIFISLCRAKGENITTPSRDLRQAQPHKPLLMCCQCVVLKSPRQPNRRVDDGSEKITMEEPSRV